jgi:flagellar biosynthesis GTPase FlhF
LFWWFALILSFIGIFVFFMMAVISFFKRNIKSKQAAKQYFLISILCIAVVFVSMLNIGKSHMELVGTETTLVSDTENNVSEKQDADNKKEIEVNTKSEEAEKKEQEETNAKEEAMKAQKKAKDEAKKKAQAEAEAREKAELEAKNQAAEIAIKDALDLYMYENFKYYYETSWYSSVSATGCVIHENEKVFILQSKGNSYNDQAEQFLSATLGFFNSKTTEAQFLVDKVILVDNQKNIIKEVETNKW